MAFSGGNGQWRLKILVMVEDETMGNRRSMDAMMDCGKEFAW